MTVSWRSALADYIRTQAVPVEKYGHQPRLYELTRQIAGALADRADDDVLYAAVWLHDLGVFTGHRPEDPVLLERWDNTVYAIEKSPGILAGLGFPAEKVAAVLECIRTHQPSAEPESVEATVLRDADILEQLGAVGIARTVCKVGRDTRFHTFTEAAVSLQRALEMLPGRLRLPVSVGLAGPRIALLKLFLDGLAAEAGENLY
jgi:uncharacterized protein